MTKRTLVHDSFGYRKSSSAIFLELITSLLFSIKYIRIAYTSEYRITLLQYKDIYMYLKKKKKTPICSNDNVFKRSSCSQLA